jgi:hypothetical protein
MTDDSELLLSYCRDRSEAAFTELEAPDLESEFSEFGAAQRTVTVTRDPASLNAPLQVVDQWTREDDSGSSKGTTTYEVSSPDLKIFGVPVPSQFQQLLSTPIQANGSGVANDTVRASPAVNQPTSPSNPSPP